MRGVSKSDLVALVDYIYQGEANIEQDQLESFLVLAEELELEGLSENSKEEPGKEEYAKEHFDNTQHRADIVPNTQKDIKSERRNLKNEANDVNLMRPKQTPLKDPLIRARIESMIEREYNDSFSCVI